MTGVIVYCSSLIATIATLIGLGVMLDHNPETTEWRRQLGIRFKDRGIVTLGELVKGTSEPFIRLFESLFGSKSSALEESIWVGLIVCPLIVSGGLLKVRLEGLSYGSPEDLLFAGMAMSITVSIGYAAGRLVSGYAIGSGIVAAFSFAGVGLLIGLAILSEAINGLGFYALLPGFLLGVGIASVVRHPCGFRIILPLAGLLWAITAIFVVVGMHTGIVAGPRNALAALGGIGISVFLTLGLMFLLRRSPVPVRPMRALASSVVFVILVGGFLSLFRFDVLSSFIDDVADEPKLAAFVGFNVFADGVSLLETRWVLQRVQNATIFHITALLIVDLVASAVIFLFSPVLFGELPVFLNAAIFQGERPWLGILFWSTFGTSAVFYLFVISVFLFVIPNHGISRGFRQIGRISNIEESPHTAIACAVSVVLTLFAIGAGIVALIIWINGG